MRLLLPTVLLPLQSLVFSPGLLLDIPLWAGTGKSHSYGIGFLPCASK